MGSLEEYGLVGAFDANCMMRGEDTAMVFQDLSIPELCFSELRWASQAIAAVLRNRLGVLPRECVLVVTMGCAAAEASALIGCARILAPFVPVSSSLQNLHAIMTRLKPRAAVVVAAGDSDPIVKQLARAGMHRVCLIDSMGSLVEACDVEELPRWISTADPSAILYILATSGSTGEPKFVRGTHRGLINRLTWQTETFPWKTPSSFSQLYEDKQSLSPSRSRSHSPYKEDDGVEGGGKCQKIDNESKKGEEAEGEEVEAEKAEKAATHQDKTTLENKSKENIQPETSEPPQHEQEQQAEDDHEKEREERQEEGDEGEAQQEDEETDVVCRRTPLTFVDAMAEIFGPLVAREAVKLWIPDSQLLQNEGVGGLVSAAARAQVSRVTLIPIQLRALLQRGECVWPSLSHVIVSGEAIYEDLVRVFGKVFPKVTLINLYGSTEVAGDVTFKVLWDGSKQCACAFPSRGSAIGQVITGNTCYLVEVQEARSQHVRLVGSGEVGELLVYGAHVADNYFPPLPTASGFMENVYVNDIELKGLSFFTGDLAVMSEHTDKEFVWLGRKDNQVKVRGIRIELEPIEILSKDILKAWSEGPNCAALVVEGTLVLVLECEETVSIHTAKKLLIEHLPSSSMIPQLVLPLPTFPLTSAGKLDRQRLRDLILQSHFTPSSSSSSSPSSSSLLSSSPSIMSMSTAVSHFDLSQLTLILCQVYSQVLTLPLKDSLALQSASTDILSLDFFTLGGDSMTAVEALWLLSRRLDVGAGILQVTLLSQPISLLAESLLLFLSSKESFSLPKRTRDDNENTVSNARSGSGLAERENKRSKPDCFVLPSFVQVEGADMSGGELYACAMKECVDAAPWFETSGNAAFLFTVSHGGDVMCSKITEHIQLPQVIWKTFLYTADEEKEEKEIGEEEREAKQPFYRHVEGALVRGKDYLYVNAYCGVEKGQQKRPKKLQRDSAQEVVVDAADGIDAVDEIEGEHKKRNENGNKQGQGEETISIHTNTEANMVTNKTDDSVTKSAQETKQQEQQKSEVVKEEQDEEEENKGMVFALNPETGKIVWRTPMRAEVKGAPSLFTFIESNNCASQQTSGTAAQAVTTITTEVVFVGSHDGSLYGLCAQTGRVLGVFLLGENFFASPLLFVSSSSSCCVCIGATTRGSLISLGLTYDFHSHKLSFEVLWRLSDLSPVFSSPLLVRVLDRELVVFGTVSCQFRAVDVASGQQLWSSLFPRPVFSSPSLLSKDEIVVGCHDGVLRCVSAVDGKTIWHVELGAAIFSSPRVLSFDDRSVVCVSTTAGHIFAVVPSRVKQPTILHRLHLPAECFCSPQLWIAQSTSTRDSHLCVGVGARDDRVYLWELLENSFV